MDGNPPVARKRLPSGVPGLDTLLNGGFFQGDIYLIQGMPGTGKTILASQLCFNHIRAGGRALYVTMLAETHSGLLVHLQGMDYFDASLIPEQFYLVSGYPVLVEKGLDGLRKQLHQMIRQHRASLLIVEGIESISASAPNALAFKQFLLDLHTFTSTQLCTSFLVVSLDEMVAAPERAMVDGLIELRHDGSGLRAVRELEIKKLRGSAYMEGSHLFKIDQRGLYVYPRTEQLLAAPSREILPNPGRQGFGISNLDEMLQGGIPTGSSTMILGAPGSGKTILSCHFMHGTLAAGGSGVYLGFYETESQLLAKAESLGIPLREWVDKGALDIVWCSPMMENIDSLAQALLARVERLDARFVLIDGFEGFQTAAIYPNRVRRLFIALLNELRARQVSALFTMETQNRFGADLEVPIEAAGMLADNIILMRYVALRSQLYRVLSVVKMRTSAYDPAVREFTITQRGIEVAQSVASAEAILREVADPRFAPPPQQSHRATDLEP